MFKKHLPFIRPHVIICRSDLCLLTYYACNARKTPCTFLFISFLSSSRPPLFPNPLLLLSHIRQWFNDYIKEWGHYGKECRTLTPWPRCFPRRWGVSLRRLCPSESMKSHKAAGGADLHDQVRQREVQEVPPRCHHVLHGVSHLLRLWSWWYPQYLWW